ncbi:hypothetical protein K501DRAFT_334454 [Backusella circina FSU 941]|nr:hypothetical protein K501DRAFT_334454 [Backusella circina FSU 941]
MACIYTVIASPKDIEYMHQLEQVEQVKNLESQLVIMEKELATLKLARQKEETDQQLQLPSPVSVEAQDFLHLSDTFVPSSSKCSMEKQSQLIAESNNMRVFVSPPKRRKESFVLIVNNGDLVINTFIQSHQDLLDCLHDVLFNLEADKSVPTPFTQLSPDIHISTVLTSLLAKSYSKQWVKSMTKSMPLKRECLAIDRYNIPSGMTTLQLVYAYINCLHLTQFYIHVPYFTTHFIQPSCNIFRSPAVMALCSAICLQACHHISAIIPSHSSTLYALYYFEQARELVCDRFDEVSLEIMITYAFMAFYKLKLRENIECLKYIDMADRICTILEPLYDSTALDILDGIVMFYRTHRFIRYIHRTASVYETIKRGHPNRHEERRNFSDLLEENDVLAVMFSDQDTVKEKEFIQLIQLRAQLQQKLHSIIHHHPHSITLTTCVGELSHQMEMAMRHWYRRVLPEKYQLSLPLFENNVTDIDYFIALERECTEGDFPPKLLSLIYLYNEYLVVGKAYVPKKPNELQLTANQLLDYFKKVELNKSKRDRDLPTSRTSLRWEKLILRIVHFKRDQQIDGFEGTESDYIEKLITCVHPEEWNFDMPVARISVLAAIHIVRLVQYLMTRDYSCFLDYRWLMNAWDMLLRASRFKYSSPEEGITLERIRANILLCMNIIQDHSIHEKIEGIDLMLQKLKREFNDSVY